MDWTNGFVEHWTIFWTIFFWIIFFTFFFWTNFWTILSGVGRPLVLREGWDVVYQYSGRGGRQTVVIERGVEDELSERREGWVVVVLVNATDYYSTSKYLIIQPPNQLDPP